MKKYITLIIAAAILVLSQGCTGVKTLLKATTVERDKKDGCTVHVTLRIGIDGTDADVQAAQGQLSDCFGKTCLMPCNQDTSLGCKVISDVIVKKWSDLSADDQKGFHHITMVNNDGSPSYVSDLGANGAAPQTGEWRRNVAARTYCHEVLHLAGLPDQYCSRIYDAVNGGAIVEELHCQGSTDPNGGSCCTPTANHARCSSPCTGHENDMMATLSAYVTCKNIMEVVANAGITNCPDRCCTSPPPMTTGKKEEPHSAVNKTEPLKTETHSGTFTPGGLDNLHYGATFYTGYSAYWFKDYAPSTTKELYSGANFGFAGDVMYNVCAHGEVGGRLTLYDFSQTMHSTTNTYGSGLTSYTETDKSGARFNMFRLDAFGEYDCDDDLDVFGGPGITFDMLAQGQSSGSITSGGMTSTYGDSKYRKLQNVSKEVTGNFTLGMKYNIPFMGYRIQPFVSGRFPFNQMIDYKASPVKNYLFELNFGATFMIK